MVEVEDIRLNRYSYHLQSNKISGTGNGIGARGIDG